MKLTLQLRLLPSEEQKVLLLATMKMFNAAATFAAEQGFASNVYSQPSIHRLSYYAIRERYGLSAQMAVRAIGKAAEAFRIDKAKCPSFRPLGAMTYDQLILTFKDCHQVSILTVGGGRQRIPYVFGKYQAANLKRIRGQCDLVYRDGLFFLYCTIDFQEAPPIEVEAFLGVDMGIVNLATDTEGERYSGSKIEEVRQRHCRTRQRLQKKGTRSSKRILRKLRKRESRFRAHTNHSISKRIVAKAKALGLGIALEDLKGIRKRTEKTVGRRQRAKHSGWAFYQLRCFIEYKACREGIPIVAVDPRYTSQTCSACKHCEKGNRSSQDSFTCKHCGYSGHADLNAARNIRVRATVVRPHKQRPSRVPQTDGSGKSTSPNKIRASR